MLVSVSENSIRDCPMNFLLNSYKRPYKLQYRMHDLLISVLVAIIEDHGAQLAIWSFVELCGHVYYYYYYFLLFFLREF